jgi:hypothetical protein
MNLLQNKINVLKADKYDGQFIYIDGCEHYEMGGYLGGGSAGV